MALKKSDLFRTVVAGMEVVRQGQGRPTHVKVKAADATLVTPTDIRSQKAMIAALPLMPYVGILAEESAIDSVPQSSVLLIDPMDGTGGFANGLATQTVIAAMYDKERRVVTDCCIGEPATGRVWETRGLDSVLWRCHFSDNRMVLPTMPEQIEVWNGLDADGKLVEKNQQTVFMDVSFGFARKGRQILIDREVGLLFASLNGDMKISIPGSNGLIQALVANGGDRVAGSITTAIGGPWDVAGALLVKLAGGHLQAFSAQGGVFVEKDPLDVMSYDILITANTEGTADFLADKIYALRR